MIFRAPLLRNPSAPKTHPLENAFFSSGSTVGTSKAQACPKTRYVRYVKCPTHRADTNLPAGIEGVRTHASISLLRASAGVLCLTSNGDWCWQKKIEVGFVRSKIRLAWAVELLEGLGSYSY